MRVIRKSTTDCHHAFCTVCSADVNISHGGIGDIKKHGLTSKHTSLEKLREAKPVSQFFAPLSDMSAINAEVLFTEFLVEHNVAFAASEHAGPLFLLASHYKMLNKYCTVYILSAVTAVLDLFTLNCYASEAQAPYIFLHSGKKASYFYRKISKIVLTRGLL